MIEQNVFGRKMISLLLIICRKTHLNAKISKIHGMLMKTFGISNFNPLMQIVLEYAFVASQAHI